MPLVRRDLMIDGCASASKESRTLTSRRLYGLEGDILGEG